MASSAKKGELIVDKTKIFLLTGFLGSGKTTLLKRILSWETDLSGTVVLVNEFGKVGIDGMLLKEAGSEVVELTSGCICCTLKLELFQTLKKIWDRFHPQRILLEATGVAEPEAVAAILEHDELKEKMAIEKIITVLDIRFWKARENFGYFFMNQVKQADMVLMNKIDTAQPDQIPQALQEIRDTIPDSLVVPSLYCEIDPDTLWLGASKTVSGTEITNFYQNKKSMHPDRHAEDAHDHKHPHDTHHDHAEEEIDYVAFDFSEKHPLDESRLNEILTQLPWELFRIKGPVRFADRTLLLNYVAGQTNWEEWDGDPQTRLAFVGWKMDGDAVLQRFKDCVVKNN